MCIEWKKIFLVNGEKDLLHKIKYSDWILLKSVEVKFSNIVFKSGVQDRVSDLGRVTELRGKSSDLVTHAQDVLTEKSKNNFWKQQISNQISFWSDNIYEEDLVAQN